MQTNLLWFPETISVSQDLDPFVACQYKWFVSRVLNYRKRIFNIDLVAGGEFAKALELTRTAYYADGLSEQESIEIGENYLLEHFGELFDQSGITESIKNPTTLAKVFLQYFKRFPLIDGSVVPFDMGDGKISVEQTLEVPLPFKHPITGNPLKLKVKVDMLGADKQHTYIVDEKTCKSLLTDYAKQADLLRTERQFALYVAVANKLHKELWIPEITHFKVRKIVLNATAFKNGNVAEEYEFKIDKGLQETIWQNTLIIVNNMLDSYYDYRGLPCKETMPLQNFSNSCNSYFRPCSLGMHCTSEFYKDLESHGWKQVIWDRESQQEQSLEDFLTKRGL